MDSGYFVFSLIYSGSFSNSFISLWFLSYVVMSSKTKTVVYKDYIWRPYRLGIGLREIKRHTKKEKNVKLFISSISKVG